MNEALEIANEMDAKHGDIITGTDYHMCSTSLIYKQDDIVTITNALDLDEFPKTVFNVPISISKFIKNPHVFYKELLDPEESFFDQDTFISYVKLSKEHEHFIEKFCTVDFEKYNYSINFDELFAQNKNNHWDIKSFNYKKK
jgi:hypothetical protein